MINYTKLKDEFQVVSGQISDPAVINDRLKYQEVSKRYAFLGKVVGLINQLEGARQEDGHLNQMLTDPKESQEMKSMAREELKEMPAKIAKLEKDIDQLLVVQDEPDGDVIVEIRAAVGGDESALFALVLFNMYAKYVEKNGWQLEVLDSHATEGKGFKEVIFAVKGAGAYTHLKFESGVHRVQRVPETEASGRVHTSTVTVAVLTEPKEVDLQIRPEDLKVDTFRSGGAGGQHVNKTESAIRITHLPTGTIVACQEERSQIKNRAKAMKVLKFKILDKMERDQADKITNARRGQVGSGDRSEKIRTYNYSERRVTDHRIGFTIYRLEQVLEGDMDEVIEKLLEEDRKKLYAEKGLL
jgi:peptide chain release factor 1